MQAQVATMEQLEAETETALDSMSEYSLPPSEVAVSIMNQLAAQVGLTAEETKTALSGLSDEAITALEESVMTAASPYDVFSNDSEYSIYSMPPSETNVEMELSADLIGGATGVSTALSASVSWYSIPPSETNVEMESWTFDVHGVTVVDSHECLRRLESFVPRPVIFESNSGLLAANSMQDVSVYTPNPSETLVTLNHSSFEDSGLETETAFDLDDFSIYSYPPSETECEI